MAAKRSIRPRNYYLNEQHELLPGEKVGGGRLPQYANINWATKGSAIAKSLESVQRRAARSPDPVVKDRYFLIARSPGSISKRSSDKHKAPRGTFDEPINYAGDDSRVLGRLGLDLLQVNRDGSALVHARSERIDQLVHNSALLETAGAREKSRWAKVKEFDLPGWQVRIDREWLASLPENSSEKSVAAARIDSIRRLLAALSDRP